MTVDQILLSPYTPFEIVRILQILHSWAHNLKLSNLKYVCVIILLKSRKFTTQCTTMHTGCMIFVFALHVVTTSDKKAHLGHQSFKKEIRVFDKDIHQCSKKTAYFSREYSSKHELINFKMVQLPV